MTTLTFRDREYQSLWDLTFDLIEGWKHEMNRANHVKDLDEVASEIQNDIAQLPPREAKIVAKYLTENFVIELEENDYSSPDDEMRESGIFSLAPQCDFAELDEIATSTDECCFYEAYLHLEVVAWPYTHIVYDYELTSRGYSLEVDLSSLLNRPYLVYFNLGDWLEQ